MPHIDSGHLYLLKTTENNYYKIGVSKGDVTQRLNAIRIGNPFEVLPVAAYWITNPYAVEKYLHKVLAKHRMHGEWFELSLDRAIELGAKLHENSYECKCSSFCRNEYAPRKGGLWDRELTQWFKNLRENYTMIKVEVEMSDDDYVKYQAIADKPEWLHGILNDDWIMEAIKHIKKGDDGKPIFVFNPEYVQEGKTVKITLPFAAQKAKEREEFEPYIIGPTDFVPIEANYEVKETRQSLCEHYQPKGQCMVKGCKYGKGKA